MICWKKRKSRLGLKMSSKNNVFIFFTVCSCVVMIIITGRLSGYDSFWLPLLTKALPEMKILSWPNLTSTVTIVQPGQNIQIGNLQVHILSAVHYQNVPQKNGFNLFLNGWARHESTMDFKCCLLRTLPNGDIDKNNLVEVGASTYHLYTQWIVDMQRVEFTCALSEEDQLKLSHNWNFTHVTFSETSCFNATENAMAIVYPKRVDKSVVVCLKISYGSIDPTHAAEWFEFQKLMGVNKVFAYTFDLGPPVNRVFEYYQSIGFLEAWPIWLPTSKYGAKRSPVPKRLTKLAHEQAWVDEVVAANDCKNRFSGYDYVMVFDLDEFIIPKKALKTYLEILKYTQDKYPDAGAFSFDSHVAMLSWGPTRPYAPLFITQYINRTADPNIDGADRNTRWAHVPHRTYYVKNNQVIPKDAYTAVKVPNDVYTLLHFRGCKPQWGDCAAAARVKDDDLVKYERQIVENILAGIVKKGYLSNSSSYTEKLNEWMDGLSVSRSKR